jgi:hypothetical protein
MQVGGNWFSTVVPFQIGTQKRFDSLSFKIAKNKG